MNEMGKCIKLIFTHICIEIKTMDLHYLSSVEIEHLSKTSTVRLNI